MNSTADTEPSWPETEVAAPEPSNADDEHCWVCGAEVNYRHCKIICPRCGFMRDCSDP